MRLSGLLSGLTVGHRVLARLKQIEFEEEESYSLTFTCDGLVIVASVCSVASLDLQFVQSLCLAQDVALNW